MTRLLAAMLLALFALQAAPVAAQTPDDIAKAEQALDAAWEKAPLTIREVHFVNGDPAGYGVYDARPDAKFKPGEQLVVYAEPVGYAWKANAGGSFTFGFDIDLALKAADGTELSSKANFGHLAMTSRAKNREFFLKLTLDVTGAEPGNYILEYKVRDIASDKSTVISLPFSLVPAR